MIIASLSRSIPSPPGYNRAEKDGVGRIHVDSKWAIDHPCGVMPGANTGGMPLPHFFNGLLRPKCKGTRIDLGKTTDHQYPDRRVGHDVSRVASLHRADYLSG